MDSDYIQQLLSFLEYLSFLMALNGLYGIRSRASYLFTGCIIVKISKDPKGIFPSNSDKMHS